MALWLLGCAIACEVSASLSLRASVRGSRWWYLPVAVGYLSAFVLLGLTLHAGLPLGVAYGVWTAVGVAVTAVASRVLFKEPLSIVMAAGIVLIAGGVLLIELGSSH